MKRIHLYFAATDRMASWIWHEIKDEYMEKYLMITVKYGKESIKLWASFSLKDPGITVGVCSINNSVKKWDTLKKNLMVYIRKQKIIWYQVSKLGNEPSLMINLVTGTKSKKICGLSWRE